VERFSLFGVSSHFTFLRSIHNGMSLSDTCLAASLISSATGKYGKSVVKRKCLEKGIVVDVFEQIWLEQAENGETGELVSAKVMHKLNDFQTIEPKPKRYGIICNTQGFNL